MLTRRTSGAAVALGVLSLLGIAAVAPGADAGAATRTAAAPATAPAVRNASAPNSLGRSATTHLLKDLLQAWKITRGSGVTVAVLSTGVDPNVSGLAGKVVTGHDYARSPNPNLVHGTLLASAIAGSGPTSSSAVASIGRAPDAKILGIRIWPDPSEPGATRFFKETEESWANIVASAIREAVRRGAEVILVEENGINGSAQLDRAVQYAIAKNVVVIGEEMPFRRPHQNEVGYPGKYPGVIGASTVFLPGLPAPPRRLRSPANSTVLVGAPGNQLQATGPGNASYTVFNAYSADAWITGTVALIKSVYPRLSPALVARALALSARDHPKDGYNTKIGFGLINPVGALHEAAKLMKLRARAAPGRGVASRSARFGSGPAPGVIDAVRHPIVKLAGFGAAVVVGLACLILAALLPRRRRRKRRTARHGAGPGYAGPGPGNVRIS